jgi:uncharacterized protein YcbK (DUF882 family)
MLGTIKSNERIAPNFWAYEFTSVSSSDIPTLSPLFTYLLPWLQKTRDQFGYGIQPTSFYRNAIDNFRVGGSNKSAHLKAFAVDFKIPDLDNLKDKQKAVYEFLCSLPGIRCAWYKESQFFHIDCGTLLEPETYGAWKEIRNA